VIDLLKGRDRDPAGDPSQHGRCAIGTIAALRDENERLRVALEYAEDACARALRLGEGDRRSDRMAYQVIDEASRVLARALHCSPRQRTASRR
jgi:hypothetical protein